VRREGLKEEARAHLFMEGASWFGSSFMECVCVC
jgi:hypothetical protein